MEFLQNTYNNYKKYEDTKVIESYKHFTGNDFDSLQRKFKSLNFTEGSWEQVATTRSTGLLGTGISLTNVSAQYRKREQDNDVSVLNSALDKDLKNISILGKSRSRSGVECCRTVTFNEILGLDVEGDYWITYINADLDCIVVVAPVIIAGQTISKNFGCYVLVKNRNKFWSNKNNVDDVYNYLKNNGFNTILNEPIVSGTSLVLIQNN